MELKDKVIAEIKKIYDPEIPVNIYDLGLIYSVKVDKENVVEIKMTLTISYHSHHILRYLMISYDSL